MGGYPEVPQVSEVIKALPRLFHQHVLVNSQCQVLCDFDIWTYLKLLLLSVRTPLNPLDPLPPLKVNHQFLCLADIQEEDVVLAPAGQVLHLLQVEHPVVWRPGRP